MTKTKKYDSTQDTLKHVERVKYYINQVCTELMIRADDHDRSKLGPEEKPLFDEMTPKLKTLEYGTEEYKQSLNDLSPALVHHYECNSHHPEHFENGVAGMNLYDLVEMFCDWQAASERTKDGDIGKSVEIGIKRFNIEPQLSLILFNTCYKK